MIHGAPALTVLPTGSVRRDPERRQLILPMPIGGAVPAVARKSRRRAADMNQLKFFMSFMNPSCSSCSARPAEPRDDALQQHSSAEPKDGPPNPRSEASPDYS